MEKRETEENTPVPAVTIDIPAEECPVCKEEFTKRGKFCVNGHQYCEECWKPLTECPLCRVSTKTTTIIYRDRETESDMLIENKHNKCWRCFIGEDEDCNNPRRCWGCIVGENEDGEWVRVRKIVGWPLYVLSWLIFIPFLIVGVFCTIIAMAVISLIEKVSTQIAELVRISVDDIYPCMDPDGDIRIPDCIGDRCC